MNTSDPMIDQLIAEKGAKPRFVGFDWTRTDKLKPRGQARRDKVVAARLAPRKPR